MANKKKPEFLSDTEATLSIHGYSRKFLVGVSRETMNIGKKWSSAAEIGESIMRIIFEGKTDLILIRVVSEKKK